MSFQAYIDNIRTKTGKTPEDFLKLAKKRGLLDSGVKPGEILFWLKKDFGLGHGHAMAIVLTFRQATGSIPTPDEKIAKHFSGRKEVWKKDYDALVSRLRGLGSDFSISPTDSYISLLRGGKKFGIIQVSIERFDIGIKLKDLKPSGRYLKAGSWNSMVTHRISVSDPRDIDNDLITKLSEAFQKAK